MLNSYVLFCSGVMLNFTATVSANMITAEALGDPNPTQLFGQTVVNGDFTIISNLPTRQLTGDGVDESTSWDFDFQGDSNYTAFLNQSSGNDLSSALLTLTLTPYDDLIMTDVINIIGLNPVMLQFQSSDVGLSQTIAIELTNYYSSDDIYNSFLANPEGIISMGYADDAILTYAKLELIQTSVPEPGAMLLLVTGLLGLVARERS